MFLVHSGKIFRVGVAGPPLWETHLSDAAGMCALHGLNWKHPKTHNSSGNQDVRQLPLGQGLGGQRIELHPHYPMEWMKSSWCEWTENLWAGMKSWNHHNNEVRLNSSKTIPVESKSSPIDKWHLLASLVPWTHSLVYLDNIIICTFERDTHRLWLVFARIRTAVVWNWSLLSVT